MSFKKGFEKTAALKLPSSLHKLQQGQGSKLKAFSQKSLQGLLKRRVV